ncbi:MAG: hypothetical protein IAG10_08935, partial [Planctomycetaceae bacterium]|nr:hypothetical protein [Planctomycetaceae bacterium]
MWSVSGKQIDAAQFRPFEPVEVLYDFDGPRSFTLRDAEGELQLAHWCDEDDQAERYLVVPFTPKLVERLKTGTLTLRDALDQPRLWAVDVKRTGEIASAWRTQLADLPPDILPHPGTMLLPSLEPLISLRAVGSQITEGRIPSSVVKALIDGVQHAVKVLTVYV